MVIYESWTEGEDSWVFILISIPQIEGEASQITLSCPNFFSMHSAIVSSR